MCLLLLRFRVKLLTKFILRIGIGINPTHRYQRTLDDLIIRSLYNIVQLGAILVKIELTDAV